MCSYENKEKVALGYLMQQILERYVQQRLLQTGCRDIPLCISHQVRQVGRTTEFQLSWGINLGQWFDFTWLRILLRLLLCSNHVSLALQIFFHSS